MRCGEGVEGGGDASCFEGEMSEFRERGKEAEKVCVGELRAACQREVCKGSMGESRRAFEHDLVVHDGALAAEDGELLKS